MLIRLKGVLGTLGNGENIPSLHETYTEQEGEEQLVFFKQRPADIVVDALCEVII